VEHQGIGVQKGQAEEEGAPQANHPGHGDTPVGQTHLISGLLVAQSHQSQVTELRQVKTQQEGNVLADVTAKRAEQGHR